MNIGISAAETSGDLLGAKLVDALIKQNPSLKIEGMTGEAMQKSGVKMLWNKDLVNVMGFSEVLKKMPFLLRFRKTIIRYFIKTQPDIFIGVDAPDFNFFIEKKLKRHGIKTVHFISPSVWAWRQSRVKKIQKSTDLLLCLLPFEVAFYQKNQQKALFVGHPLTQNLTPRKNHIAGKNILLMPGSRADEIKRLLPEMLSAMRLMCQRDDGLQFHLVLANQASFAMATQQTQGLNVQISVDDAHQCIGRADLVLVASGTAALEVALVGVPMVVVYKLSALSYFIAKKLLKSRYISLPNIILNKSLVPELIQKQANPDNIAQYALQILAADNQMLIEAFSAIHAQLKVRNLDKAAQMILALDNE